MNMTATKLSGFISEKWG